MTTLPIQIVEAIYAAFGRRDIPTIFSLLAPDVEIEQSEELPWGGCYRGHDGARQFLGALTSQITSTVTIDQLVCSGAHVAATGWTQGTVNSNGASFKVPLVHLWKTQDGRVTQVQFFIENASMLEALRSSRGSQA